MGRPVQAPPRRQTRHRKSPRRPPPASPPKLTTNLAIQTRITTRYSVKPAQPRKDQESSEAEPKPPRGCLEIKTYDPASGVVLKYRTTKAAEVSRLIQSSEGQLGRGMAGVPDPPAEEAMLDAPPVDAAKSEGKGAPAAQGQSSGGGGGGGKKKRKGKK